MVDEQLRIHTEKAVEQVLVRQRSPGHIPQGVHAVGLQLFGVALAHSPKIRQGSVGPQLLPEAPLIQLRNPGAVFIRFYMLGPHIHSHLT